LKQQELEENNGHRRKRKSCVLNAKETQDRKTKENVDDKVKEEDKNYKAKPERKMLPPPMEFAELLKLAEKKQYEPIIIDNKPKIDEERPMTKRQKKEWEYLQEKERRERERMNSQIIKKTINTSSKSSKIELNKIPKKHLNLISIQNKNSLKPLNISEKIIDKSNDKHSTEKVQNPSKDDLLEERKRLDIERRHLEEMRRAIEEEKKKLIQTKNKQVNAKSQPFNTIITKSKFVDQQITKNIKLKSSPSEDLKSSSLSSNNKLKQFSLSDIKPVKSKKVAKKSLTLDKKSELFIHNKIIYH